MTFGMKARNIHLTLIMSAFCAYYATWHTIRGHGSSLKNGLKGFNPETNIFAPLFYNNLPNVHLKNVAVIKIIFLA